MDMKRREYSKMYVRTFITAAVLFLHGAGSQSIITAPNHIASKYGDSSMLHCTVDRVDDTVEWSFHANGTTGTGERLYLYDGNPDNIQLPNPNYNVDLASAEQGIVDLTIIETSAATAGQYICQLFVADLHSDAQAVSVAPISCDPPPGEYEVLEGATVLLTCEAGYIGYKPPSLSWTPSYSTSPLPGDWIWNHEKSTFVANVTAEPELDMMDFVCDLTFLADAGETRPPPVYNDTCTTHFLVLHGATSIAIVPEPDGVVNVDVGDTINCTASGRPLPTYTWEGDMGEFYFGSTMIVQPEWTAQQKIFTCFAHNELNGQPFEASLSIEILVE